MGIYLNGLDYYPAVIRCEGAMYTVKFVDIPGCSAYGASAIEAEINAGEALYEHVVMLRRYGRPIPEPSADVELPRGQGGYVAYIRRPGTQAAS